MKVIVEFDFDIDEYNQEYVIMKEGSIAGSEEEAADDAIEYSLRALAEYTAGVKNLSWTRGAMFVINEESDTGVVNTWGPFFDYETAQEVAMLELESMTGVLRDDPKVTITDEDREGPWTISHEDGRSWSVCQVIDNTDGKAGLA